MTSGLTGGVLDPGTLVATFGLTICADQEVNSTL